MIPISIINLGSVHSLIGPNLLGNPLVEHMVTHEIVHIFFSMIRGSKKKLTRAQRRKLANQRRRWFTDNIIMHHKRLHDRNRELVINSVKDKVAAKRIKVKLSTPALQPSAKNVSIKSQARQIHSRIDTRRLRARSRWQSVGK